MKQLNIKFVDFWDGFDEYDNIFIDILKDKFIVTISDNPEYIFYSVFGDKHLMYDCCRIFYTGENARPDFNVCDYGIGFDYMFFGDRYLRFPLYLMKHYNKDYVNAVNKHIFDKKEIESKTKFCNFVYSNARANPKREEFFNKLNEYKKVDSGGRYLNNIGGPIDNKFEFQQHYKFTIAFENSLTSGYTTEKIIQAFAAKTIPIYWGNPDINKEFNTGAFINCHEYNNFDEVIERIRQIENDEKAFLDMLSEPIYTEKNLRDLEYFTMLSDFLYKIFAQDKAERFRRDRYCWAKSHEDSLRSMIKLKKICKRVIPSGLIKIIKS